MPRGMLLSLLDLAKEIALSHQEKWDGSIYPQGLSGKKIPFSAIEEHIVAIASTRNDK